MKLAIVSIEDKRFAEHNGVDSRHADRSDRFRPGDADTRGGSTIEQQYVKNYQLLVIAQTDAEKRAGGRDHPGAQAARDPDGADARQDVHQAGDPDPLPQPGVVRQRRIRHQDAAQTYFGIDASALNWQQAALLAGWCSRPAR